MSSLLKHRDGLIEVFWGDVLLTIFCIYLKLRFYKSCFNFKKWSLLLEYLEDLDVLVLVNSVFVNLALLLKVFL